MPALRFRHTPHTTITEREQRAIKSRDHTQDIPFDDVVEHGCADVDAALRLYGCLHTILKEKGIDHQFASDVMPVMRLLGDKELDGVRVDTNAISHRKGALATEAEAARASLYAMAGKQFDVDSMKEIAVVLREIEGLREQIGRLRDSLSSLRSGMSLHAVLFSTSDSKGG